MKKNNAVQTAPKHSMLANQAPVPQKSKVSSQMTLSDSILSGAVVEFRKAGYRFMRHLHTNIEIYRILSGECYMDIQSETLHCTEGDFIMILPDVVHSFYLNDISDCEFSTFISILICFQRLFLKMTGSFRSRFFMLCCFLLIFITGSVLTRGLTNRFGN